jgi:hypothetical protein
MKQARPKNRWCAWKSRRIPSLGKLMHVEIGIGETTNPQICVDVYLLDRTVLLSKRKSTSIVIH